jgi:hypothetical protein
MNGGSIFIVACFQWDWKKNSKMILGGRSLCSASVGQALIFGLL